MKDKRHETKARHERQATRDKKQDTSDERDRDKKQDTREEGDRDKKQDTREERDRDKEQDTRKEGEDELDRMRRILLFSRLRTIRPGKPTRVVAARIAVQYNGVSLDEGSKPVQLVQVVSPISRSYSILRVPL